MLDYQFCYIISIPIYILLLIILIRKKTSLKKVVLGSLFYFYIIIILWITIFPIPIHGLKEIGIIGGWNNNFIPFMWIFDILSTHNMSFIIKQIIGNILLFIPMGFFIALTWKNKNHFKKYLLIGFLCSVFIESLQYTISFLLGFNYRITDIDDVLLNTLGFVVGLFLYRLFYWSVIQKVGRNNW